MQAFHDAHTQNDPYFTAARDTSAFALNTLSQELAIDETGRVRLPDAFIKHARLTEDVTFVGMGRKFEIWDTASFASVFEERLAAAVAQAQREADQAAKP